jgi:MFS family permease
MSSAPTAPASAHRVVREDDTDLAQTTMRRVSLRLIPLIFVLFVCNYMDRMNVAMAKLQMMRDLHFSDAAYSFGVSIFFVGYALLEVPSNLILARVGARRWIARIMITWGLIASAMMFVRTPIHFYALRFLLGVAEAGFFPGIVYYLSLWFPAAQRARTLSRFIAAAPISSVIGSPLSGWLLSFNGWHGVAGWQWVFLLEGIPSVLIGVAALLLLTDRPSEARWLTLEQREWLVARLERDEDQSAAPHGLSVFGALLHPAVLLLSVLYFFIIPANWVAVYWAPTVIQTTLHVSDAMTGVITGAIAGVATLVMLLVGASSDRTGERFYHASSSLVVVALGCVSAAVLPNPFARVAGFAVMQVGVQSFFAPFWCLPSAVLRGAAAAAAIALVNSFGNLGGIVGPWGFGLLQEMTGSMTVGLFVLAVLSVCAAALCVSLRWRPAFAPVVGLRIAGGGSLPLDVSERVASK